MIHSFLLFIHSFKSNIFLHRLIHAYIYIQLWLFFFLRGRSRIKESLEGLDAITSPDKPPVYLLREEVKEFLPLVRFLAMTTDEFIEHVLPTGIFTDSEAVAILKGIKQVPGASLPEVAPLPIRQPRRNTKSKSVSLVSSSKPEHEQGTTTSPRPQGQYHTKYTRTTRSARGGSTNTRNNTRPFLR